MSRKMAPRERQLAERFRILVARKRPVLGPGYGTVDPHHVIKAQTLRAMFVDPRDPEPGWSIVWDPDNGVPVRRDYHEQLTSWPGVYLKAAELRPENIDFAKRLRIEHLLLRRVPSWRKVEPPRDTPIDG